MTFDDLNLRFAKLQFSGKQRSRTYKKLAGYLQSGVSLNLALKFMYLNASEDGKKPKNPVAVILNAWRERVGNGDSFGQAVSGWVPDGDRVLLEGGEKATLQESLKDCIKIQAARKQITKTIWGGLGYPVMLLIAAIAFLVMFARKIMPAFETVMPLSDWKGSAALMAKLSAFADNYIVALVVGAAFTAWLIYFSMPRWVGKIRVHFDRVPPWSLYRIYAGAGFMLVLSAMKKAGIQDSIVLMTLRRGSVPWFEERMGGALRHIANGDNIGEALYKTQLQFPDKETVRDLRGFAEQDGFDDILREMGNQWIEEAIEKITVQTGYLRNVSFLFFGAVLGLFSTALTDLQSQVTAHVH